MGDGLICHLPKGTPLVLPEHTLEMLCHWVTVALRHLAQRSPPPCNGLPSVHSCAVVITPYKDVGFVWIIAHTYDLILITSSLLYRPDLQTQSHSEVLGVRVLSYTFVRTQFSSRRRLIVSILVVCLLLYMGPKTSWWLYGLSGFSPRDAAPEDTAICILSALAQMEVIAQHSLRYRGCHLLVPIAEMSPFYTELNHCTTMSGTKGKVSLCSTKVVVWLMSVKMQKL